jgi:hypothetical protein
VDLVAAELRRTLRERSQNNAYTNRRLTDDLAEVAVTEIEKLEREHTDD